jgi:hypothetical protein
MNKNTFYISCPIDTFSGYGSRSRDVVKALIELDKYDVKIVPQVWGNTSQGFIEDNKEKWGFLSQYIVTEITTMPDIWCQITITSEFRPLGKYNLGISAGIETNAYDPSWIEGVNRMDLTLVSSKHSKDTFLSTTYDKKDQNGNLIGVLKVEKPIEVLFEGIDPDLYKPIEKKSFKEQSLYKDLNNIPEKFAFLFMGHWLAGEYGQDRKNVGLLIKSFYETFKNKTNPPALILKTSGASSSYIDRDEILRKINIIKNSIPKGNKIPNIYLLHGDFSDSEINELYNHPKVKAMVNLTKGEGFGRPLLEFSLVNKPIITTNWSGHTDFLKPDFSWLMGGTLTQIHPSAVMKNILIPEAKWFSVDLQQVGLAFMDVYSNYKIWQEKARRQGFYSRTTFSFEKMKTLLGEILNKNIPQIPVMKKLELPRLKKIEAKNI